MKLVIEYDPWADKRQAERAAAALNTLGLPTELRAVRMWDSREATEGPVGFDAPDAQSIDTNGNALKAK